MQWRCREAWDRRRSEGGDEPAVDHEVTARGVRRAILARKSTRSAISSGAVNRPVGARASCRRTTAAGSVPLAPPTVEATPPLPSQRSVRTGPGLMVLTRISGPSSLDSDLQRFASAPFAALLATALTRDDFAAVQRGCPFINASAEFTGPHPSRVRAGEIQHWVTERLQELLRRLEHRDPRATAEQLMMVRTGAVVSGALDENADLSEDFLS
jgi:hypothetical protein